MKVKIKTIENGWLVHYEVYEDQPPVNLVIDSIKTGEEEKAFTYDFDDEREDAWRRLVEFISKLYWIPLVEKEVK